MSIIREKIYLSYLKECFLEIRNLLDDYNDTCAVVKGGALSKLIYGDASVRKFNDVDILIPKKKIKKIKSALINNEFDFPKQKRGDTIALLSLSHQIVPWFKSSSVLGDIVVDINHDIFWGEYEGRRIDMENFLSDTVEIEICGVNIKTLPPVKACVQLMLHHYKDLNSIYLIYERNHINKRIFEDVFWLIYNNKNTITINELYDLSLKLDVVPYIYYMLYFTNIVMEDKFLSEYVSAFETREGIELLGCYGLCKKERKLWKHSFETRYNSNALFDLIKPDLNENNIRKIEFNKKIFKGENNDGDQYF